MQISYFVKRYITYGKQFVNVKSIDTENDIAYAEISGPNYEGTQFKKYSISEGKVLNIHNLPKKNIIQTSDIDRQYVEGEFTPSNRGVYDVFDEFGDTMGHVQFVTKSRYNSYMEGYFWNKIYRKKLHVKILEHDLSSNNMTFEDHPHLYMSKTLSATVTPQSLYNMIQESKKSSSIHAPSVLPQNEVYTGSDDALISYLEDFKW